MEDSPQLENGYTRIANEILEQIIAYPFSAREMKILFAIIRKTYGYGKKEDEVSAGQLSSITGVDRVNVVHTLTRLARLNVIQKKQGRRSNILGFNKQYQSWLVSAPTLACRVVSGETPSVSYDTSTSVSTDTKTSVASDTHKRKKEKRNRSTRANGTDLYDQEGFLEFWDLWPKKAAKLDAAKVWRKLSSDDRAKAIAILPGWSFPEDKQFIPGPDKWLRGRRWEDGDGEASGVEDLVNRYDEDAT